MVHADLKDSMNSRPEMGKVTVVNSAIVCPFVNLPAVMCADPLLDRGQNEFPKPGD